MKSGVFILAIGNIWSVWVETADSEALRVIGGYKDRETKYPWVVFMFKNVTQSKCTGSLLSPTWMLAAAHCVAAGERVYLYENGQDLTSKLIEQMQYGRVVLTIPHDADSGFSHDIALYKITALTITKFGKLSAIDYRTLAGREVAVMGFGIETFLPPYQDNSNLLNWKTNLRVASGMITQCGRMNLFTASKPTICIVRPCGEVGLIAPGDSGGPVVYDGAIVGINSHIYDLSMSRSYIPHETVSVHSVYAVPISIYLDWISKTLTDNKYN